MLHETWQEGTCAYLYDRPDALFSSSDLHCPTLEDAREDWDGRLDPRGWISMEDPLPGCQHDCPLSVRITGRDRGAPQWGQYKRLQDGEWKDFTP